jgi:hypothetical protein
LLRKREEVAQYGFVIPEVKRGRKAQAKEVVVGGFGKKGDRKRQTSGEDGENAEDGDGEEDEWSESTEDPEEAEEEIPEIHDNRS